MGASRMRLCEGSASLEQLIEHTIRDEETGPTAPGAAHIIIFVFREGSSPEGPRPCIPLSGFEALGDQRIHNGTRPTILTPEALAALKERIKTLPDDGGLWTGPKIARWFAKFHGLQSVHDQRGWDALIAIGYSIQQPRPRHPDAATEEDRAALKKNFGPRLPRRGASIRARPSKSGRWMNTASV